MIPLSAPNIAGNEWTYIKDCLDTGWVSSAGAYVGRMEEAVARYTGSPFAVATSNGTTALHISLLLAGVQAGDLVLSPDITFVAPVNAIKYLGADPLLVDSDPENWQMDLEILESFLAAESEIRPGGCFHMASGKRIGALLPVHVLGAICDMERLMAISGRYRVPVVEDSTEALGSRYRGRHAGTFGLLGCFSFNGNKIITTGGGGMVVTADSGIARRCKHLTTQAKAGTGEYFHDEVGYNYRMVNLLAAMGVAQMEQLPAFLDRKAEITRIYNEAFAGLEGIRFRQDVPGSVPNHWLYTIQVPRLRQLREYLESGGIECRPLWVPMHLLPAFRDSRFLTRNNQSEYLYQHAISLPCSTHLTDAQQQEVIGSLIRFFHG